ncbi:MAG: radical SAM-associated putative lipoprotein [Tannerella sp.]|jgi:putative lipoprotein (rSAM/lipoprotein system)|nr:radical SAM-associated putative lipoprotein [Tannerella sp.]
MTKKYKLLVRSINWVLAGVLTLLGFGNCTKDNTEEYGVLTPEYGVPSAKYTVRGKIAGKADGKAVKGIRLGYAPSSSNFPEYGVPLVGFNIAAAAVSDANGNFILSNYDIPNPGSKVSIYVDDIDGDANGLFKSDTLHVDFSPAEQINGEFTVETDIQLTEEE